jgi:hypothetical protein
MKARGGGGSASTEPLRFYLASDRIGARVYVGPFASPQEAARVWFFAQPKEFINEIVIGQRRGATWPRYLAGKLYRISDFEMRDFVADPGGYGYVKVEIKSPRTLRTHSSWKSGWGGATNLDEIWHEFTSRSASEWRAF